MAVGMTMTRSPYNQIHLHNPVSTGHRSAGVAQEGGVRETLRGRYIAERMCSTLADAPDQCWTSRAVLLTKLSQHRLHSAYATAD
eukprot:1511927-Rhodomonas_salina.2